MTDVDKFVQEFKSSEPLRRTVILESQRAAVTRAKAAQTRSITAAKKWLANAVSIATDSTIETLLDHQRNVRSCIKKLEHEILLYINICEVKGEIEDLENEFTGRSDGAQDVCISISKAETDIKAIMRGNAAAAAPPQPPTESSPQQRAHPIQDLKPYTLDYGTSPTAFNAWIDDLNHYFQASRISSEEPEVQQGYLHACLSGSMKTELRSLITAHTPVFGPEGTSSCINTLRLIWRQRHPIFSRRCNYVSIKQDAGETVTQLLNRIDDASKDADVASMSRDDWNVQIALNAITDKRVSSKWMEASEPDYEELRVIANSIDTARARARKGAPSEPSAQAKVFASKPSSSGSSGGRGGSSSGSTSKPLTGSSSQCYHCGSSRHTKREDCPVFKKALVCHKCNRQGHLQKMCKATSSSGSSSGASKSKKN